MLQDIDVKEKWLSKQDGNMKDYVYDCLNKFGNAYISNNVYRRLGPKKILKILENKGYNCKIVKYDNNTTDITGRNVSDTEYDIIIQKVDKHV